MAAHLVGCTILGIALVHSRHWLDVDTDNGRLWPKVPTPHTHRAAEEYPDLSDVDVRASKASKVLVIVGKVVPGRTGEMLSWQDKAGSTSSPQ